MPKPIDHYILKRYIWNGYISEIASIGSFLSPTSWVVSCWLLVIWITTTIPSKKGMWRNESPFLHIPFLLCFHLVQGSRFRALVAASPQLYMGDARSRIILAPSSGRGRRAKRGGVGIPVYENTASRSQPPPLRGTSFQRKEGEKRSALTGN